MRVQHTLYRALAGILLAATVSAQLPMGAEHRRVTTEHSFTHHPRVQQLDVEHLHLVLEPEMETGFLRGSIDITGTTLLPALGELDLDFASNMDATSATVGGERAIIQHTADLLRIHPAQPLPAGSAVSLHIEFRGRPDDGWLWVPRYAPDGTREVMIHTQGETQSHHFWFPCYDFPSDLCTSEVEVLVPDGYSALSNGVPIGVGEDGLPALEESPRRRPGRSAELVRRFHWRLDQPHATYLLSVIVGKFDTGRGEADGIPLAYHVPRGQGAMIEPTFGRTPQMLRTFNELLGVKYPWPRYDQVIAFGFEAGGMENTSMTTLYEGAAYGEADSPDFSADSLIAHELSHQWWGDLITCADWAHIWLHESFATYFAALWFEHSDEPDAAAWEMLGGSGWYFGSDAGSRRPIVWNGYDSPQDMFDALAYPKGGWVLQMLRHTVGDDAFFKSLREFLKEHAHKNVVTEDLLKSFNTVTESDLGWFFDEWLHHGGHPEYRVRQQFYSELGILQLNVEQVQTVDELTPLFRMPIDIEIVDGAGESHTQRLEVAKQSEVFMFACAGGEPRDVRFDKGSKLLKQLDFEKPTAQLLCQLAHDDDVMGRRTAAEALVPQAAGSDEVRAALAACIAGDPSVRLRALVAEQIGAAVGGKHWRSYRRDWDDEKERSLAADAARDWARDLLLTASRREDDSRVTTACLTALVNFPGNQDVLARLTEAAASATKTYQRAAGLRALGVIGNLEQHATVLLAAMETPSHREILQRSALRALTDLDHPQVFQLAAARLQPSNLRDLREAAFGTLEKLGDRKDPQVVALLLPHLNDHDRQIRGRAISLLGRFGYLDPGLARANLGSGSTGQHLTRLQQQVADALAELDRKLAELKAAAEKK